MESASRVLLFSLSYSPPDRLLNEKNQAEERKRQETNRFK
jgi:hypothetical protein